MALTVRDILMDADLFRRAYPCWPYPAPEETPMTTTTAPARIFSKGDRVLHLGYAATVTIGNTPDEWLETVAPVISIRYDKAPRGHSACKDVYASECLPVPGPLASLRAALIAKGVTADSPVLDAEGERLARDEHRN